MNGCSWRERLNENHEGVLTDVDTPDDYRSNPYALLERGMAGFFGNHKATKEKERRKTMSDDYRKMWESLGLDLAAHDALLAVLGKAIRTSS